MKKKLFIHIGTNKTGSTAIQEYLENNKSLHKDNNILHYCETGKVWNAHFPLAWELGAGIAPAEYNIEEELWKKLLTEIQDSKAQHFVISSENFLLLKYKELEYIKNILKNIEINIIVFIRRQDRWVESLYLQSIKMGIKVKQFSEYMKKPGQQLDFQIFLKPWEDIFSEKHIIVINFDNKEVRKNLIKVFIESVGYENTHIINSNNKKESNESITREMAEFLLKYNHYFDTTKRLKIIQLFNDKLQANKNMKNEKYLNDEDRKAFLKKFHDSNSFIAKKYFDKINLFDTDMPSKSAVMQYTSDEIDEINEKTIAFFFSMIDFDKLLNNNVLVEKNDFQKE